MWMIKSRALLLLSVEPTFFPVHSVHVLEGQNN